jgi:1-phosphofructokinase
VVWEQSAAAGKGVNVASFLADFGYRVAATGFLGRANAGIFENWFREKGIRDCFVRVDGATRANLKLIDEERDETTDLNFPGLRVTRDEINELIRCLDELARDTEWFVLSGSIPPGAPSTLWKRLAGRLRKQNRRVVVDASGDALRHALTAVPFAAKPNLDELRAVVGRPVETDVEILEAASLLLNQGVSLAVVSMGRRGALFADGREALLAVPPDVRVRSTVGAGDAMVAGLVAGKLRGLGLSGCARLATGFAASAVGQIAPRTLSPVQVEALTNATTIRLIEPQSAPPRRAT